MKKNWNFSLYQTASIHHLLEGICEIFQPGSDTGSVAVVLPDGKALHVRAVHPADIATLPMAASQCHQYLKLADGDLGIVNDPYSGGSRLSDVSLVTAVKFEGTADAVDLLIACRLRFPARQTNDGRLDAEGVRIPPMKLGAKGVANRELLSAIEAAPQAPSEFVAAIEAATLKLNDIRKVLLAIGRDPNSDLRKVNFKRYLQDCHDGLKTMMGRLPLGETLVSSRLESGELLKLRIEVTDDKIVFDFSGTEASSRVQLTELATFGACFQSLRNVINEAIPANAGTFQMIEVMTPTRAWVNAVAPAATAIGVSDGIAFIGTMVLKAFGRLNASFLCGQSGFGSSRLQFEFADGRMFSNTTAGGMGAAKDRAGIDGLNAWLPSLTETTAIETIEREFPIQIKAISIRPASGGKGRFSGGHGLIKTFCVQTPAKLTWSLEQVSHKPEGAQGGKSGQVTELTLQRAGSDHKEELSAFGSVELNSGDTIRIHTAGGGGFGEPETAT